MEEKDYIFYVGTSPGKDNVVNYAKRNKIFISSWFDAGYKISLFWCIFLKTLPNLPEPPVKTILSFFFIKIFNKLSNFLCFSIFCW